MNLVNVSVLDRETRLCHKLGDVGHNLAYLATDLPKHHIVEPLKQGNPVQAGIGFVTAAIVGALKTPAAVVGGVIGRRFEPGTSSPTLDNADGVVSDLRQGKIGSALSNAWEAITDWPVEMIENGVGVNRNTTAIGKQTRSGIGNLGLAG